MQPVPVQQGGPVLHAFMRVTLGGDRPHPPPQVFTTAIANYKSDAQYRGDVDDKAAELTKGQEHEQVLKVQERRAYELRALETVKTWLGIPCCVHRPGVVKEIASSKCPRALFTLLPYIQRVNEYTKESTVIAHFCKRYVLAEAKAQMTPHDKTAAIFVMELDGEVQNEQQVFGIVLELGGRRNMSRSRPRNDPIWGLFVAAPFSTHTLWEYEGEVLCVRVGCG